MLGLMARKRDAVIRGFGETLEALGIEACFCCGIISVICADKQSAEHDSPFWTRRFASWRERKGRVFLGVLGPILMVLMSTPSARRG